MELNGFDKYGVHALIPQNNENGGPEIKNIGEKFQDKNDPIIHNDIRNSRWNQITDMITEFDPALLEKLDNETWKHCKTLTLL